MLGCTATGSSTSSSGSSLPEGSRASYTQQRRRNGEGLSGGGEPALPPTLIPSPPSISTGYSPTRPESSGSGGDNAGGGGNTVAEQSCECHVCTAPLMSRVIFA